MIKPSKNLTITDNNKNISKINYYEYCNKTNLILCKKSSND